MEEGVLAGAAFRVGSFILEILFRFEEAVRGAA